MSGSPCQGPGTGLPPPISDVIPGTPLYELRLDDDRVRACPLSNTSRRAGYRERSVAITARTQATSNERRLDDAGVSRDKRLGRLARVARRVCAQVSQNGGYTYAP
jgi:hypothetical protein